MLAFHYEALGRHRTLVNNPMISPEVKLDVIRSGVDTFMDRRFELLCRECIRDSYAVGDVGTLWGRAGDGDTDMDVVATVYEERRRASTLMVGCLFSRGKVRRGVLDDLMLKTESTASMPNLRCMVISVSGFDRELEDAMDGGRAVLVGTDKLLGRVPPPDDPESFPMMGLELIV